MARGKIFIFFILNLNILNFIFSQFAKSFESFDGLAKLKLSIDDDIKEIASVHDLDLVEKHPNVKEVFISYINVKWEVDGQEIEEVDHERNNNFFETLFPNAEVCSSENDSDDDSDNFDDFFYFHDF